MNRLRRAPAVAPIGRFGIVLTALAAGAGTTLGFAGAYALSRALPGADWVAFIAGFLVVLGVLFAIRRLSEGSVLVTVLAIPPALFTFVSTVELPGKEGLASRGERVDVVVRSHEVIRNLRGSDRHLYRFVRQDGTRIGEELVYRGFGGNGLEVGDRTTVLMDPLGRIPLKLARDVPGARGSVVVNGALLAMMIAIAALVGHRRRRRWIAAAESPPP